jgi:hypothetical protein
VQVGVGDPTNPLFDISHKMWKLKQHRALCGQIDYVILNVLPLSVHVYKGNINGEKMAPTHFVASS